MPHTPTILVADEDLSFISSLACQVQKAGVRFIAETSPELALMIAQTRQPDLVVLDTAQTMGRALLSWLRKDPVTRHIKVLVLSYFQDRDDKPGTCLEMGADDYDLKPCDFTVADKVVRLARGSGRSGDTARAAANDFRDVSEVEIAGEHRAAS